MEEETLSEYPLQIQSTGFDLTSMMIGSQNAGKDSKDSGKKNEIKVQEVVTNMFSTMNSNDLASLKSTLTAVRTHFRLHKCHRIFLLRHAADLPRIRRFHPPGAPGPVVPLARPWRKLQQHHVIHDEHQRLLRDAGHRFPV